MAQEEVRLSMTKKIVTGRRAKEIVENFPHARVLVVGDMMVDHFIWGKVSRISPEAPVPVVEVKRESYLLGGSANVLHNVIAMGGQAFAAGVIGADARGAWLVRELKRIGVDTGGIVEEKGRPTTVKTRIVAHSQQMVRYDRESRQPIRPSSIHKIVKYAGQIRNGLGAVILSDYSKGVLSEMLLNGIREVTAGRGIMTCVDPKQSDFSLYRGFDVITPNHHEAHRALGIEDINGGRTGEEDVRILKAAKNLLNRLGLKALLITRGEEGMSLYESSGGVTHIPAVAREVFDVTGAGDTTIGVFSLSLAAGASFREAAFIANQAAGIAVGKVGTATVSREELVRTL
jgi:rfaE bifunctional protein kinase chain/domain